MEIEEEENSLAIIIESKKEKFCRLSYIQKKCNAFLKDIHAHKKKTLEEFRKIIFDIETCSEFNYYFLKFLKDNKMTYIEEGEKWDYQSNLDMLKETLTDKHYKLLENKTRPNPLEEIQNILKEYLEISNKGNKNEKKNENTFANLILKNPLSFQKLNFPLISGIERLRVKYYKDLILEKDITTNCKLMKSYISIMNKDKDIFNYHLNEDKFNPKTFLLILTLTTTFNVDRYEMICNFFKKNITEDDYNCNFKHIEKLGNSLYKVNTYFESKIIKGKDYILTGLDSEIDIHPFMPLDFLLFRHESYKKFENDGGKGFIDTLGLYNSFISYIKDFIRSKAIKQLFEKNTIYKNVEILLNDDKFLEEMLDESHFRFLPFYGSDKYYGYTNKDLMMCFINSIPELPNNIYVTKENKGNDNLKNICLLLSIGVKFVTSLHEFIFHLVSSYLFYLSSKKLDSDLFIEDVDKDDGGFCFERLLKGDKKFQLLNLNIILVLLDGVSCNKNLLEFQKDLKAKINIDDIKIRLKNGKIKGFLKIFLEKYPIDFDYFKNNKNMPTISCRSYNDIGVSMIRDEPDSYGGR